MAGGEAPSAEALALLDAAPCGLAQTSDDGTFRRVNRTFCQWVGCSAEMLIGQRRFQDLLTMGGRIFHQTHWAPLLRMQGSISEVKLELRQGDGGLPIVVNAIRRIDDGEMVHDIAAYVARDRDTYERELLQSRKRLEQLVAETNKMHEVTRDRALFAEQMVGIVSHDLRNPLSTILMGAGLLARGQLSDAQRNFLTRVTRSAERANRLIADLLDFTQARIGKGLAMSVQPIDLHEVVSEAVDELALLYPDRRLDHVRVGAGECSADSNRLTQMVGNLVSNAMTYGDREAPVTVTSAVEARTFCIAVHNFGPPIPEPLRQQIFEPMTRGVQASSPQRSVGLGLFIVREICRGHGGAASVESAAGVGTTFRATFPRR